MPSTHMVTHNGQVRLQGIWYTDIYARETPRGIKVKKKLNQIHQSLNVLVRTSSTKIIYTVIFYYNNLFTKEMASLNLKHIEDVVK